MTALHTLAACLVFGDAAPPQATPACDPIDHGCKARRSEQRAASATQPDEKATYLRSAHLSYLSLFDKTGDAHDLCSARKAYDASLAVKDQTPDERARTRKLRGDLVSREKKAAAPCKGVAKQQRVSRPEAPPVAASATSQPPPVVSPPDAAGPSSEPPPLLTSTATPEPPPALELSPSAVHPPPPSATGPRPDETLMRIPNRRTPTRPQTDGPLPGRGLVIAGGVILGAGVALTAGAGHLGRRMNETRQEHLAFVDSINGFGTPEQDAKANGLLGDYKAMRTQAVALAVAGGATIVVAAVLAGVGGRRMARAASRTALVPVPGGLALFTRF